MGSSKKCPYCQEWSAWHQLPSDRCEHCEKLLDPRAHHAARQEEARSHQRAKQPSLAIKPGDGAATRFTKRIAYGAKWLFAAIISLLVALVAAVAG